MRKLVAILASTTAIFAATTFYYARELQIARGLASVTMTANPPSPARFAASSSVLPGDTDANSTMTRAFKDDTAENVDFRERWRLQTAARAKESLPQLQDPIKRKKYVDEAKRGFRITDPTLARHLKLSEED